MKYKVLIIVNSTVGKRSNIGYRAGHIFQNLPKDFEIEIISRDTLVDSNHIHVVFPFGAILSRFLNAIRIYLFPKLPSRKIDNYFFYLFLKRLLRKKHYMKSGFDLVHLWESEKKLYTISQKISNNIILDVPIEPSNNDGNLMDSIKFIYEHVTQIIVPSNYVRKSIEGYLGTQPNIVVNYFGTNVNHNYHKRKKSGHQIIYLFVGNVNSRKGADTLIEAWKTYQAGENEYLWLCGRIDKYISKLIKHQSIKNIEFFGHIDPNQKFSEADVFILPTTKEGSAKAIYEAMSYKLPVITTENAGSIVEDQKQGFIIEPRSVSQIHEKLQYFRENPNAIKVMGDAAFEKVKNYSWNDYTNRTYDIYRKVIKDQA